MKWIAAALIVVGVGAVALRSEASHLGCHTGDVQGFATIRADPQHLVGTIPASFSAAAIYFSARYNCKRTRVQVRRVDQGIYDVRFPGVNVRTAVSDAISTEGVSSSVQILGDVVRVSLRGPLQGSDVAARRDVPFNVVVY